MPGLAGEEDSVSAAIADFLTENGFYATVMTQYDDQPVYVQKLSLLLFIRDDKILFRMVMAHEAIKHGREELDLIDPDSLDTLLAEMKRWEKLVRKF